MLGFLLYWLYVPDWKGAVSQSTCAFYHPMPESIVPLGPTLQRVVAARL